MKKILSIICALSILMSVLIIPSAFNVSAEDATTLAPTALRNMTETTVENETVYVESAYGANVMVFDYEIEAGCYYLFSCDFMGAPGAPSYGKPISATTYTDSATTFGSGDIECVVLDVPNSKTTWGKINTILKGDDLLKSGGKYFSIFYCYSDAWDGQFKNFKLTKLSTDESSLIASSTWRTVPSVDADGNLIYSHPRDGAYYSNASITFDYEIESGYTYFISFDWMGGNYNEGGYTPKASTVASPTDIVSAKVDTAVSLGTPSASAYTPILAVISGDDLLASGGKYLAINWVNLVTDPHFRNLKIAKVKEDGGLMHSYLHKTSISLQDGELVYTSGTWDAGSITFDYQIEEGYDYYLSFDYMGHNYFQTQTPGASTVATKTTYINGSVSTAIKLNVPANHTTSWKAMFVPLDGDALLASGGSYLAINWVHANPAANFKNFKIAKVAKSGNIIPTAVKNGEMFYGMEDNRVYWYCDVPGESYKNPTFSTDFEIEKGKKYAVNFDYKYTGSMVGGMWLGSTDTTATSVEGKITQIQPVSLSSAADWTNTTIFFDTTKTDLITDTSKYFAFRSSASWGAPKLYFSNLTITEVSADCVLPIAGDKFTYSIVDGEVIMNYSATTAAGEYDTVGFTTDYVLENNKEYIVAFDYMYNAKWLNDSFRAISTGTKWDENRLRPGKMVDLFNAGHGSTTEWSKKVAGFTAATDETNTNLGFAAMANENTNYELSIKGIKLYENGDVNLDGKLETSDIALLKKTLIGADAEGAAFTNISLDAEDSTNVLDLVKIKKILASKTEVAE